MKNIIFLKNLNILLQMSLKPYTYNFYTTFIYSFYSTFLYSFRFNYTVLQLET